MSRDPNYSYSPSAPKERPTKQCEECGGTGDYGRGIICQKCDGKGEIPDDSYVPDAEDAGDEKQHREREEEIIEGRK